jgi:hypothetical protein
VSIYRLLIELVGKDKGATRALKSAQKETLGLERAAQKLQGGLAAAAGIAGMAYVGKQALDLVSDLYMLGAQAQRLETAFDSLARGAGGSADAILSAIKKASGGTVSEMDAMAAANKGILLGLGANAAQWEKLTEIARVRGRAMGLTVTQALSDITVGLGRQSAMILDNLGITLDLDATYAAYAETLGKTAKELTNVEQKQALVNKVIEEGSKLTPAGGIEPDAADKVEQLASAWEDVKTEIAEAVVEAGVLQDVVDALLTVIRGASSAEGFVTISQQVKEVRTQLAAAERDLAVFETAGPEKYSKEIEVYKEKIAGLEAELARLIKINPAAVKAANMQADALKGLATQGYNAAAAMWALAAAEGYEATVAKRKGGGAGAGRAFSIARWKENKRLAEEVGEADEQAAIDAGKVWDKVLADRKRAWEDLKSTVEAALQPTTVTALDVEQTAMGTYADKWDEDARRLDAIAARGFAELDAHPDWAGVLEIPPEILGSTEDVLKEWARQQSTNFRNLLLPLGPEDVAAAVERVRDYVQQQAQREANIETIALAYQAKFGGTEEQARAALGDTGAIGGIAADDVMAGFTDALEASTPAAQFASYFKSDIDDETANLNTRGVELWQKIEKGLLDEMSQGNYVDAFATILAPYVADEIGKRVQYTGGGTTSTE